MKRSFLFVLCAMFLFLGVIIGFIWAPIKGGVYCGNNNGNNNVENCSGMPSKAHLCGKEKSKKKD